MIKKIKQKYEIFGERKKIEKYYKNEDLGKDWTIYLCQVKLNNNLNKVQLNSEVALHKYFDLKKIPNNVAIFYIHS